MKYFTRLVLFSLVTSTVVFAAEVSVDASLVAIDEVEKLELESVNVDGTIWGILENEINAMKFSCIKSFANQSFCTCLSKNLPNVLNFQSYVAIITRSKLDHGYINLTQDERQLINMTRSVRDECAVENMQ